MPKTALRNFEFELFLLALGKRYGLNLSGYARTSLMRRVQHFMSKSGLSHISELIPKLLHDRAFLLCLLADIAVSVTELFRDPQVFLNLRGRILPTLKNHPYLKIWHAGCASGEEVYSLAIMLHELQMLNRATIYATDISSTALEKARLGIYDSKDLARSRSNYKKSGGIFDLSDYFVERYEHMRFHGFLRTNVTFAEHNLVSGDPFGGFNLIFCRNVFIYFDRPLQSMVAKTFANSLVDDGILVLGTSESLQFIDSGRLFEELSSAHKIYRKKTEVAGA